jgi:hypothetical protein
LEAVFGSVKPATRTDEFTLAAREAWEAKMDNATLVGTWQLVSYEYREPDGTMRYPLGKGAVGRIIYSPGGRMAVQVMNVERPALPLDETAEVDPAALRANLRGYIAYFGTYMVDWDARVVTHLPEGSLNGVNVGRSLPRHFVLDGNRLTLRTRAEDTGGLTWERVE